MIQLYNLIKEAEFKVEMLPQGYFIEWFKTDLLPKLKKIANKNNED